MNYKNILRGTLIASSLVLLAACSTTGSKYNTNAMSGQDANGVSTQGLGSSNMVNGIDLSGANKMKPGYNQIYFFDYDQSTIHSDDLSSVDVQGNYLASHPNARILLTGNTDERGSAEYNIALGNRRAVAVAQRLKSSGATSKQMNVVSYGAEKPIAQGQDDRAYSLNRNVQLIYKDKG